MRPKTLLQRAESIQHFVHESAFQGLIQRFPNRRAAAVRDVVLQSPQKHRQKLGSGIAFVIPPAAAPAPMQISTWLKLRYPHLPESWVSHTTIYRAIKLLPRGELKHELLSSAPCCAAVES